MQDILNLSLPTTRSIPDHEYTSTNINVETH